MQRLKLEAAGTRGERSVSVHGGCLQQTLRRPPWTRASTASTRGRQHQRQALVGLLTQLGGGLGGAQDHGGQQTRGAHQVRCRHHRRRRERCGPHNAPVCRTSFVLRVKVADGAESPPRYPKAARIEPPSPSAAPRYCSPGPRSSPSNKLQATQSSGLSDGLPGRDGQGDRI